MTAKVKQRRFLYIPTAFVYKIPKNIRECSLTINQKRIFCYDDELNNKISKQIILKYQAPS